MDKLTAFIMDPIDPIANLELGYEYETKDQWASAISHYIRGAENSKDKLIIYNCLVRTAICFSKHNNRNSTVDTLLKRAVACMPYRPEAYFLLALQYERNKQWNDCYMLSCICETLKEPIFPLPIPITEYPGLYSLVFEKGVSAWWIGNCEEARTIIYELSLTNGINEQFTTLINNNIHSIGVPKYVNSYIKSTMKDLFKFPFPGFDTIEENYSQVYQDLFVLMATKGMKNGFYLEIGCGDPFLNSNTALLEQPFGWDGVSIDNDFSSVNRFNKDRKNSALLADAITVNYKTLLQSIGAPKVIDYLQLDCEPPVITYNALKRIPFGDYKFKVITYEHDCYRDSKFKDLSRKILRELGYVLVVSDIAFIEGKSFEDWWVHPDYVDYASFKDTSDKIKVAKQYMFNN